jgi:hypothetical protein
MDAVLVDEPQGGGPSKSLPHDHAKRYVAKDGPHGLESSLDSWEDMLQAARSRPGTSLFSARSVGFDLPRF